MIVRAYYFPSLALITKRIRLVFHDDVNWALLFQYITMEIFNNIQNVPTGTFREDGLHARWSDVIFIASALQ